MEKTHYRRIFKSDYLGRADLEDFIENGKSLVFTITNVVQIVVDPSVKGSGLLVAGKRINANVAHFKEGIKPLLVNNVENCEVMFKLTGSRFTQDWNNVQVELYINPNVKLMGQTIGGVRIKPEISITIEALKKLYKEKFDKVAENQMDGISRVIDGKEVSSYQKVYNYLNKL